MLKLASLVKAGTILPFSNVNTPNFALKNQAGKGLQYPYCPKFITATLP
jgi:hypothetical protein